MAKAISGFEIVFGIGFDIVIVVVVAVAAVVQTDNVYIAQRRPVESGIFKSRQSQQ